MRINRQYVRDSANRLYYVGTGLSIYTETLIAVDYDNDFTYHSNKSDIDTFGNLTTQNLIVRII